MTVKSDDCKNFGWNYFRYLFTAGSLSTCFASLCYIFSLRSVIFLFQLLHGLMFDVVYLVLSAIALIYVPRLVFFSINTWEKFSWEKVFLICFYITRKSPVIICLWWGPQKEESAQSHWSVYREKDTSSLT